MSPGSSVRLGVIRDGNQESINVTLAQMQNQQQAQAGSEHQDSSQSTPRLGLSLAPARATGTGSQGVVVTAVDPEGPAADRGIQQGDVILNVGGTSVSTPGDVQKQLAQLQKSGKHEVLMRVKSGDATRYVALPLAAG
jgi:serine protease Do